MNWKWIKVIDVRIGNIVIIKEKESYPLLRQPANKSDCLYKIYNEQKTRELRTRDPHISLSFWINEQWVNDNGSIHIDFDEMARTIWTTHFQNISNPP